MPSKSVIIKIDSGRIWFNDSASIEIAQSNLPVNEIRFGKVNNIFWLAEQVSYDMLTHQLQLNIADYFLRDVSGFREQNPRFSIQNVLFANLCDPVSLKTVLRYYSRDMNLLDQAMEAGYTELAEKPAPATGKIQKKNILFRTYESKENIDIQFDIWFKDAEFKLGYVAFDKNISELKQMVRFKVMNDFLLPEFELIKGYFTRALGTRKFDVKAAVYLKEGKATDSSARSQTINKIDEKLIDSIKYSHLAMVTRAPFRANVDKSLFTSEDIFDQFGDNEKAGNVFSQSEEEMLKYILERFKVRNRKQLEYLSGVKQAPGARLKFTLHPNFGFLFTVEGEKMMHFIWELLNTHATYIWSLDKGEDEIKIQYRRVEDAINQVRNRGREQYKQAWRSSHIDQDLVFHVIHHEDANSPFREGFVKWRHRIGELMI